jgi:hypothetical protein
MNAKEQYIASRDTLRLLEGLIREDSDVKIINKTFKLFREEYLKSSKLYSSERESEKIVKDSKRKSGIPMLDIATGKTTFTKKSRKNAPRMLVTKY